jgi:hypothetical protein
MIERRLLATDRSLQRGAHTARAGTDWARHPLAADDLNTWLARVQVIDVPLPLTLRADLVDARPRQGLLLEHRADSRRHAATAASAEGLCSQADLFDVRPVFRPTVSGPSPITSRSE